MRTVRQPTLKTWLWLAVVGSVVLASQVAFLSECITSLAEGSPGTIQVGMCLLAIVGSWLLPLISPFWIRSSLKVGIVCGLLQLAYFMVVLFCFFYLEAIVYYLFGERFNGFFLEFAYMLPKCSPITQWIIEVIPTESMILMFAIMFVGVLGYGATSYFIAESFRQRESQ